MALQPDSKKAQLMSSSIKCTQRKILPTEIMTVFPCPARFYSATQLLLLERKKRRKEIDRSLSEKVLQIYFGSSFRYCTYFSIPYLTIYPSNNLPIYPCFCPSTLISIYLPFIYPPTHPVSYYIHPFIIPYLDLELLKYIPLK